MQYTNDYLNKIEKLKEVLGDAEAVVIGAGAGLSVAAGFSYSGKRFHENFHDFEVKYNFHDMYTGGFYPYPTAEEYWAYWSRYIYLNRYCDPPKPVYEYLLKLVEDKNYFVITTNVDHCFQKTGFNKQKLFYTQGDYGLFQCSAPCHDKTYDNKSVIFKMRAAEKDMKIPPELLPKCPVCGKPMAVNLRADDRFVEDSGWHAAAERYIGFLSESKNKKTLFLELGVGYNTPAIIKYPFMKMAAANKNGFYAAINTQGAYCPETLVQKSIIIERDIFEVLSDLIK